MSQSTLLTARALLQSRGEKKTHKEVVEFRHKNCELLSFQSINLNRCWSGLSRNPLLGPLVVERTSKDMKGTTEAEWMETEDKLYMCSCFDIVGVRFIMTTDYQPVHSRMRSARPSSLNLPTVLQRGRASAQLMTVPDLTQQTIRILC